MTLLTGCATRVYSPDLEIYCPPIVTYSDDFNNKLLEELLLFNDTAAIDRALRDYIALRDKIKLCYSEREKYGG